MATKYVKGAPITSFAAVATALAVIGDVTVRARPVTNFNASATLTASRVVSFSPVTDFEAFATLLDASEYVSLSPVTSFTASATLDASVAESVSLSPVTGFTASASLEVLGVGYVAFSPVTDFTASATLDVLAAESVSLSPVTEFTASASLDVLGVGYVAFSPVTDFSVSASLDALVVELVNFSPSTSFRASSSLTGGTDLDGLTVCDVLDEVLGMWGIFNRCSAPAFAIDRAINDINTALQMVWNNADGRKYWSSSTLDLTFAAAADSQDLADDIQSVVGPCRLKTGRRPLAIIGTIGELESFSSLYLDGDSPTAPVAYHIERLKQAGNDPAKTILRVTPAPTTETHFLLDVIKEAPRFTADDLTSCPIIPIPHTYAESLLLPIARYQASSFYLFRKADQKPTIDREYQQARVSLGLADPLPGKSGDNNKNSKEVEPK